jgi:hypothetical protein
MSMTSDPKANARLAIHLRENLARRKAQIKDRAAAPEASELVAREMPVHDPKISKPR